MSTATPVISSIDQFLGRYTDEQLDVFRSADPNALGNAQRVMVISNGNNIYVTQMKTWFHFDARWRPDEDDRAVSKAYAEAMTITLLLAQKENNKFLANFANRCLNSQRREQDLKWLRKEEEISRSVNLLDNDPLKLGTPSGVLDLKTGKLCKVSRDELITKSIAVDPVAGARSELFEDYFLPSVCCGDKDLMTFLQTVCGYLLTGTTKEEKLFFFYGEGRNGKGTLLTAMGKLMGDYFVDSPSKYLEENKYFNDDVWAVTFKGKRFALTSEVGGGRKWDKERINSTTGGDPISGCAKYQAPMTFFPSHKFIVHGNKKPQVDSDGEGFWSRMCLVPFKKSFFTKEEGLKKGLKEELQKPEHLVGVLNWAIKGCLMWQKKGLIIPKCVEDATKQFRKQSDSLREFYKEVCEFNPEKRVIRKALFMSYKLFCDDIGVPSNRRLGLTDFYDKVGKLPRVSKLRSNGKDYFVGIDAHDALFGG
ncbi:phage/plasmid primase, P4 family [Verrucomicrobiales bacterium]|nr:phage/plasmid primase, P4 family [Verrucomicrobiales bacterium]